MSGSGRVWTWAALLPLVLGTACSPSDDTATGDGHRSDAVDHGGEVIDDGGGELPGDGTVEDDGSRPEVPDTPGEVCGESGFEIARVIPDMLIVLDRSNSMSEDGFWVPVRDAIYNVTEAMDFSVYFGLMIFPNVDGAPVCSGLSAQCEAGHGPIVEVAEGNFFNIRDALGSMTTCGGTPTAVTLQNARAYLDTLASDGHPKFVLLATDGAPNCNDALDGASCTCTNPIGGCVLNPGNCLDDARTYSVIDDMRAAGIQTFVLGIGTSSWMDVLNEMASRGGTSAAFLAEDPAAIRDTLDLIAGSVASCAFDMASPTPDADPNLVNFDFDDVGVRGISPPGPCPAGADGWTWTDDSHTRVEFCGSYCTQIMDRSVTNIRATWGCPTILI